METMKRKNHSKNRDLTFKNIFIRCLLFTVIFFLIGFLTVLITSYFLYKTNDPTSYAQIAGISSLFATAFITSFIQSRINKQHYFASSLILGRLVFALSFIIFLLTPNNEFNITNFVWRLLIPVFCVLGGMLGISRNNKKRKHHR